MRLTVLTDNNSIIDQYLLAEPGLSFHIEDGCSRVLFDCGYSDVFLQNADALGIELRELGHIVLSHSHLDHSWGLHHLIQRYSRAAFMGRPFERPQLTAHPEALTETSLPDEGVISSGLDVGLLNRHFSLQVDRRPVQITENLLFLGEIPRIFDFEAAEPIGVKTATGEPDTLIDDTALVFRGSEGLTIITGCSHAGICNICEYAKEVCSDERIISIIGGLHLLDAPVERLEQTLEYLKQLPLEDLYACHCTDLAAKIFLARGLPVRELGSGSEICK